jgi:hypothetical protein
MAIPPSPFEAHSVRRTAFFRTPIATLRHVRVTAVGKRLHPTGADHIREIPARRRPRNTIFSVLAFNGDVYPLPGIEKTVLCYGVTAIERRIPA